jgi:hypothetical protein
MPAPAIRAIIEIRLVSAITLDIRNDTDGCSVEIVDASTETSIRRVVAIDAPIKSSSIEITI